MEYLTDWVMGTSNQAADDDIKSGPSQYGGGGVSVSWPASSARGGRLGGADGVQVPALPQVTTTCFTHIPFI